MSEPIEAQVGAEIRLIRKAYERHADLLGNGLTAQLRAVLRAAQDIRKTADERGDELFSDLSERHAAAAPAVKREDG